MIDRFNRLLVPILIVAIATSQVNSQVCVYHDSPELGYLCELFSAVYLSPGDPFVITGQHIPGGNDGLVVKVITTQTSPATMTSIPQQIFAKFPNLRVLELPSTNIETLSGLTGCDNLESLRVNGNRIRAIPAGTFEQCGNLKEITIDSNEVINVDVAAFRGIQNLETISLENNSISTLYPETFSSLPELQSVNLQSNELREIPGNLFINPGKLNEIRLGDNYIGRVATGTFRGMADLASLSLNDNDISEIEEEAFHQLNNLTYLDLYNNTFSRLNSNSFSPLPSLVRLRIDNVNLEAMQRGFFGNFPNLQELNAERNPCVDRNVFPNDETNFVSHFEQCFQNWESNNNETSNGTEATGAPDTTTGSGNGLASKIHLILAFLAIILLTSY